MHHIVAEEQYNSPGGDSMKKKEMESQIGMHVMSQNGEKIMGIHGMNVMIE